MKIFYNENYTASKYAFDTTRKSKVIYESLLNDPIKNVQVVDPAEFFGEAVKQISKIHSGRYVDAVLTGEPAMLAESQGFDWDAGIYTMAVSHTAGLIAATDEVLKHGGTAGSLSSGLHHANIMNGTGYCTFNGLAAAAKYAQDLGVERTLIIDFDAHAGGGTWDIISNVVPTATQIDVTCAAFDTYQPEGDSSIWYVGHQDYAQTIQKALFYASKKLGKFDLIIYNAGMDPINSGVAIPHIKYRERVVREYIGDTPAIFALAGGYTWGNRTLDDVSDWHRITINTWAKAPVAQTTID